MNICTFVEKPAIWFSENEGGGCSGPVWEGGGGSTAVWTFPFFTRFGGAIRPLGSLDRLTLVPLGPECMWGIDSSSEQKSY